MKSLTLHPDCKPGPIRSVNADVIATQAGCRARFRLDGDVAAIKVPKPVSGERADNLWQTTCLEIFWQPQGGSRYREFNLSPSSRWACYDFDCFRQGMRDADVASISVSCSYSDSSLELEADIASELPVPADVALNGIVEDREGNIQFWALAFAEGKADFHNDACRTVHLVGKL